MRLDQTRFIGSAVDGQGDFLLAFENNAALNLGARSLFETLFFVLGI